MINENTAFENYCSHSNIHGGYASKRDFVAGWQAAKQSMQGEALGWVWIIKHEKTGQIVNYGFSFDEIERPTLPVGLVFKERKLYTHAPDSAARIAELESTISNMAAVIAKKDDAINQGINDMAVSVGMIMLNGGMPTKEQTQKVIDISKPDSDIGKLKQALSITADWQDRIGK